MMHAAMRVGNAARELEDNGVEDNEARLLEQAAAELLGLLDRNDKNGVGDPGQRAFRLVRDAG